ncbi:MAG: hypothetical protein IJ942_06240 [Alistipes sp.]|nr:hypothetical protein [Alistipes sp.]
MKKIFVFAVITAAMSLVSCGATKQATNNSNQTWQQTTQVNNKSSEQPQTINLSSAAQAAFDNQGSINVEMIDFGFGRSGDRAKALRDALKSAQNNIAIRIYRTLSIVDKEFAEDITIGDKISSKTQRSDMIIGIVDRKTATISYSKAPEYSRTDNIWEYSVEVKLTPELLKSISSEIYNSLSSNDELKVKFDAQKFEEEVYNKQLEEFRKNQSVK